MWPPSFHHHTGGAQARRCSAESELVLGARGREPVRPTPYRRWLGTMFLGADYPGVSELRIRAIQVVDGRAPLDGGQAAITAYASATMVATWHVPRVMKETVPGSRGDTCVRCGER